MLSKVPSAGLIGIESYPIEIEVDINLQAFPKWHTVGLPENAVKESKERVIAAIKNSGYDFAQRKITINLAPADIKKEGTAYDLPIALGLLSSSGLICKDRLKQFLCLGELSLDGQIRSVQGILPVAMMAARGSYAGLILPEQNAMEAAMVEGRPIYAIRHISEAVEFLAERTVIQPFVKAATFAPARTEAAIDFQEIAGQFQAKRALEVAASGGHNIIFIGPPGSGKTMLASRLPTILPPLTLAESLETSQVYSVLGLLKDRAQLLTARPFRAPHHSISDAGLIGGGTIPRPGEVSLAHHGVLFLDELPEFKRNALEVLRQPLESGEVTITRSMMSLTFPSQFMLVAALNPCPCGYQGHPKHPCVCTPQQVHRYRTKLSGPLLDRIDLQIEVPPVSFDDMIAPPTTGESSQIISRRVMNARVLQYERFKKSKILLNSHMGPRLVRKYCELKPEGKKLLKGIVEKFCLSARTFDRILKVSRTLADMNGREAIGVEHLLEAVQYRSLDRSV